MELGFSYIDLSNLMFKKYKSNDLLEMFTLSTAYYIDLPVFYEASAADH